jgi:Ca2+-binding EF-hand superfamily protein
MRIPIAALIGAGLFHASAASAQQSSSAQTGAVPVPRTAFIQTMDGEFGKMDADKDKVLTKLEIEQFLKAVAVAEAGARARALFTQLDADKNGQLSLAEFGKLAVAPPGANATPMLTQSDLNRDGRITLVEYRTAKLANFDRMDADKDGIVTVPEMKAAGLVK